MPSEKSSLELEAVTPPSGATVANGVAQPNGDLEHVVETHTVTSSRARTCAEIAVLCLVIGLVCGLLALPTVFYHLPQVSWGCSYELAILRTAKMNTVQWDLILIAQGSEAGQK